MPPGLISGRIFLVLGDTHASSEALTIKGSASEQKFPMERPGGLVEGAGIDQESGSSLYHASSEFRKPEVVAYSNSHFAVFCVKDTNLFAWDERFGLVVGDLSWDVDVEEVHFVVLGLEFSLGVDHEGSIAKLVILPARNCADGVHLILFADFLDG
jgi:hypothetical protein